MALLHSLLTPRLCLRCWQRGDVDELSAVIERDLDHLRPWLPWAEREPVERRVRLEWVDQVQLAFETGIELYLGIWARADGRLLGGHGLHRCSDGGPYETGYWVASTDLRHGVAREATAAVTRFALRVMLLPELLIRIRPGNVASGAVAEALGFRGPFNRTTAAGDRCGAFQPVRVYTLDAAGCDAAPWSREPVVWVDTQGRTRAL